MEVRVECSDCMIVQCNGIAARYCAAGSQDERKFILELIRMYRDLPTLWKVNSPDYSNRVKKAEAYNILVEKFNERYPGSNRETVVKKINSLRTNYRKKHKKISLSKILDHEQTDIKLWYYDEMSFLNDQQDTTGTVTPASPETDVEVPIAIKYETPDSLFEADDAVSNGPEAEPQISKSVATSMTKRQQSVSTETSNCLTCLGTSCAMDIASENEHSHCSVNASRFNAYPKNVNLPINIENGLRPCLICNTTYSSNTLRDRNGSNMTKQLVSTTYENQVSDDNEFEYLTRTWALDLQQMDPKQRLFARKAISDVLFEGMLGNLDRNSVKISTNQ